MARRFLVTGGAGFVGSHAVAALLERGDSVTVLDSFSTGHRAAVMPGAALIEADLADSAAVEAALAGGPWHAVLHFAALSKVGESMREPMRYLRENAGNGIGLIDACVRHGVERFVLSSTAALFNPAGTEPIAEDAPPDPQSAYGESKLTIERALRWAGQVHGLRFACLRYFNAAGADPAGRLGEDHRPETHLVPLAIDAALGRRGALEVFGTDYPTRDGTCVRDYVHVSDLADAHLLAVERLDRDGSLAWNLGSGSGHSVLEVMESVRRVSGLAVPHRTGPRRAGDAAVLVASRARAVSAGWSPRFDGLDGIVRTAFAWRQAHPGGYGD